MVLALTSLGAGDQVRNIVASVFSGGVVTVTVDTPYSGVPANGTLFEIHRGLRLAGVSGIGHTVGRFILPNSASAVDDFYSGTTLYIPSAPAGQKIQKVVGYVGASRRCLVEPLETALAAAPADGCGFMMSNGSFGYASSTLTGVIAPVPFRVWYNNETILNVIEPILPTGENSFSISEYHVQVIRAGSGAQRAETKTAIAKSPVFTFPALGYAPAVRIQFGNLYRESNSDGYSVFSFYSPAYQSGAPPVTPYAPGIYVPVSVDYEDDGNYPVSRYPVF
jgi:hypothetical protein